MQKQEKYEVRFTNGVWGRFDTYNYTTVEIFDLKVDVDKAVAEANKKFAERRQ